MASQQLLLFKKITAIPSTFEKGCVYFYSSGDARSILLGTGSTTYLEFKGTDQNTWRQICINGASIGTSTFDITGGTGISVEGNGGTATVKLLSAGNKQLGGIALGYSKNGNKCPVDTDGDLAYVDVKATIVSSASDDDVVVLTAGANAENSVSYTGTHRKQYGEASATGAAASGKTLVGASKYISGNTVTSISGYGASQTIKVPQLVVNEYGHVTYAADESITITMPSKQTAVKNPNALKFGSKSYNGSSEQTITAADLGLDSALKFHGTSNTAITDGSTTQTVTLSTGSSHKAENGCVLFYGNKEFVWNGSSWEELGNEGDYKVKQTAVSSPDASGTTNEFIDTISQDANGVINPTKKTLAYATASAVGGFKAKAAGATIASTSYKSNGSNYYGVNIDSNGFGYVALPTWSNNAGTVTSITPGVGLKFSGKSDGDNTAITSSGTIDLQVASTTEIGGIQLGYTQSGQNYPVQVSSNKAYVNVPWVNDNTTYSFTGGTNKFTVTPSVGNAYDVAVTPRINKNVTYTGTPVASQVAIFNAANSGVIKSSGYTIASSVPANAKFTDTTYAAGTGVEITGTNNTINAVWTSWVD